MTELDFERECRRQFDDGEIAEVRATLLKKGFLASLDPKAQELFCELFPPPAAPQADLERLLAAVQSPALPDQLKAASKLNSLARKQWSVHKAEWLTDPRTIGALLTALDDAETRVAVEVIGALGAISQRYEFADLRIRDRLLEIVEGCDDSVRVAIVQAIAHFGGPRVWRVIAESIVCKPAKAAHFAVGLAAWRYGESAKPAERKMLARSLESACAKQRNLDALNAVVRGLRVVGDSHSVPALAALGKRIESKALLETIDTTVEACQDRD